MLYGSICVEISYDKRLLGSGARTIPRVFHGIMSLSSKVEGVYANERGERIREELLVC